MFVYDGLDRLTEDKRYLPDGTTLVSDELYTYNALGALKTNANVVLDDQRPKLAGGGTADAAVPATLNGQPVDLNAGGFVTSMNGASFTWSERGFLRQAQDPVPAAPEQYTVDAQLRRIAKTQSGATEFYYFEGMDRVAVLDALSAPTETYLFDGIDHPLRITQSATSTIAYYELDLAGNVRHLFASGGGDLGGYRYTAFGKTEEDTTTITQPLRWKGRWFSSLAGGIYDVRARQWAPEMGVFLAVDELENEDYHSTLWAWARQNPLRFRDPEGRDGQECPYFPPDVCDPGSKQYDPKECKCRQTCPQSAIDYCRQFTQDKKDECIRREQAKGKSFSEALTYCTQYVDRTYKTCLAVLCPQCS